MMSSLPRMDRRQWLTILSSLALGQMLSVFNSGTNIFCTKAIRDRDFDVQIFPTEILYHVLLLFGLLLIPFNWKRLRAMPRKLIPAYVLLGAVDFGANVAVLKAFNYLSSVSVMVITSTSAIFVMFMAMACFKRRYCRVHYIGAAIVTIGLVFISAARYIDDQAGSEPEEDRFWLGTALSFLAAFGYALSNTINEYVAGFEQGYPVGALTGMGVFGSIVAAIVCHTTKYGRADRDLILAAPRQLQALLLGYVFCMYVFYLAVPWFIQTYSAVHLNFNLLTADVYVLLYGLVFDKSSFSPVYLVGFVFVLVGMGVFNVREPVDGRLRTESDEISMRGSVLPTFAPAMKTV